MIVVLATEFKDNLDYYLDQVSRENQQVIIKSGEDEFLITKLTEVDRISLNPQLIEKAKEGYRQFEAGEYREILSGSEL